MKKFFRWITRLFLFFLIFVLFARVIIWGKKGYLRNLELENEILQTERKIKNLQKLNTKLERKIRRWQEKEKEMIEKIARRDLQMAYPEEIVYFS